MPVDQGDAAVVDTVQSSAGSSGPWKHGRSERGSVVLLLLLLFLLHQTQGTPLYYETGWTGSEELWSKTYLL